MFAKAKAKAAAAGAAISKKAAEIDEKHDVSGKAKKAGAATAKAAKKGAAATAVAAKSAKANVDGKIVNHKSKKEVEALFKKNDTDNNGYLDSSEVEAFCAQLGLQLKKEDLEAAIAEMEAGGDGDGKISMAEFMGWWESDTEAKAAGSIAQKLAVARDASIQSEIEAGSPLGRAMAAKVASEEAAAAKAEAAACPAPEPEPAPSDPTDDGISAGDAMKGATMAKDAGVSPQDAMKGAKMAKDAGITPKDAMKGVKMAKDAGVKPAHVLKGAKMAKNAGVKPSHLMKLGKALK